MVSILIKYGMKQVVENPTTDSSAVYQSLLSMVWNKYEIIKKHKNFREGINPY